MHGFTRGTKKAEEKKEEPKDTRVEIDRVVFDTPAMLNMVKHCQTVGSRGIITGVLNEIKELSKHELEITKSLMTDENQAAILTNEL